MLVFLAIAVGATVGKLTRSRVRARTSASYGARMRERTGGRGGPGVSRG